MHPGIQILRLYFNPTGRRVASRGRQRRRSASSLPLFGAAARPRCRCSAPARVAGASLISTWPATRHVTMRPCIILRLVVLPLGPGRDSELKVPQAAIVSGGHGPCSIRVRVQRPACGGRATSSDRDSGSCGCRSRFQRTPCPGLRPASASWCRATMPLPRPGQPPCCP